MKQVVDKIRQFLVDNEAKIVLAVGLILVAALAFEGGYLKGKSAQTSPLVIEKPVSDQVSSGDTQGTPLGAQNSASVAKSGPTSSQTPALNSSAVRQDCAFVGSKNSTKYHLPTCRFAKLIKPENLVCFKSAEEAIGQGRVGDKGCVK